MTATAKTEQGIPASPDDDTPLSGAVPHTCGGGITVWLAAPGIVRVKLPEHADVAGQDALDAAEMVRTLAAGRRHPLLLDLTKVKSVSRPARNVYGHPTLVKAYALLGDGPVDRVLAHYFLRGTPENVPAKFFESEPDALQWLGAYVDGS